MAKRTIRDWAFEALDLYLGGKEAREVAEALDVEPGEVRRVIAYFKNAEPRILEGGYRPGDPAPRIVDPQALEEARRNGFVIEAEKSRNRTAAEKKAIPVAPGNTNGAVRDLREQYKREIRELRDEVEREIRELRKQHAEAVSAARKNALSPDEVEQLRGLLKRTAPAEKRKDGKKTTANRAGVKTSLALLATAAFGALAVRAWMKSRA